MAETADAQIDEALESPDEPKIGILSGKDAAEALNLETIHELAGSLSAGIFPKADVVCSGIRERIRDCISPLGRSKLGQGILDRIYPKRTSKEHTAWITSEMQREAENGNTTLITVNGKVAATVSAYLEGKTKTEGRNVYMIGRVTTLPQFRGHRYAEQAEAAAIQRIQAMDPEAAVMLMTNVDAMKHMHGEQEECAGIKWRDIGIDGFLRARDQMTDRAFDDAYDAAHQERLKKGKYTVYFHDPHGNELV